MRFDPEVPGLLALGARAASDFLEVGRGLEMGARAQPLRAAAGRCVYRVPLPGTPDASGVRRELPRGAGTGWLRIHVWSGGPLERLRARLSAPRSTSPAARRWNLACHLRGQGVLAPRPLAMIELGGEARGASILVERELEGFEPLPSWLARARGEERANGLEALGLALAALARSGVKLANARAEGVLLRAAEGCEGPGLAGLPSSRLPAVAFEDLDGARLGRPLGPRRARTWLERLERTLPAGSTSRSMS